MKTKLITAFLLTAGFSVLGASAQTPAPSSPASASESTSPAPSRTIYSPRLPSANELTNVAAAQGLSVERIDQTDSQVTVTYKAGNGQLSTVAYQLLPTAGTPAPATTTSTVATPSTPAPTVVYTTAQPAPAPTVVYTSAVQPYSYYYDDPFYYPWGGGYYSPVSVNLGFGFYRGFGYGGGGYRGGWHGGGWHGHGHR